LKQMSHGASSVNGDEGDASENEEFLRNVIDQTMAEVDKDNSGTISFEEFKNVRVGTPPPLACAAHCVFFLRSLLPCLLHDAPFAHRFRWDAEFCGRGSSVAPDSLVHSATPTLMQILAHIDVETRLSVHFS
jgi:hypothetical protein